MKDPLKALFGKPDYSRIVRDTTATISITAAEMAAVLEAHDRIDTLDGTRPRAAVELLGKLSFNFVLGRKFCRITSGCRITCSATSCIEEKTSRKAR